MAISCECGTEWKIRGDIFGHAGEVVLQCENCGETYFNAQEFFTEDEIGELKLSYPRRGEA